MPVVVIFDFSLFIEFSNKNFSLIPFLFSLAKKFFLFFAFKVILILVWFEQINIQRKLRISVSHEISHIHVFTLIQKDAQKLFLVRDLIFEDGLGKLFETARSELS